MTSIVDERFAEVRAGSRRREGDIYALYAEMRTAAPFWRSPWGDVYLSSWRLVDEALTNRRLSHTLHAGARNLSEPSSARSSVFDWMIFQEGSEHALLRRAFQGPFTSGDSQLARHVEAIVADQLGSVARNRPVDVVSAFTRVIPERVIGALVGVPDSDMLRAWSNDIRTALDVGMGEIAAGTVRAVGEFTDHFEARLSKQDSGRAVCGMFDVTDLVAAVGTRATAANLAFIAFAGHETTVHLVASMLLHLAQAPEVWRALRDAPLLTSAVVSEVLRLESPVQKICRWALDDLELCDGNRLRKGEEVVLLVGAANRDPDRFTDPDRIVLSRGQVPHLAFGKGIHACLGRSLAMMEGDAILRNLAGSVKSLGLDEGGWEWIENSSFRGLRQLTMTLKT
jgi:hypothetical protein